MWENSLWIASKIRGTYKKKPKKQYEQLISEI